MQTNSFLCQNGHSQHSENHKVTTHSLPQTYKWICQAFNSLQKFLYLVFSRTLQTISNKS